MYENLKAELKRRNLTYQDIATVAGVIPATIARRAAGMADWKLQEIWKIADYLHCSIDYLVGRETKNFANQSPIQNTEDAWPGLELAEFQNSFHGESYYKCSKCNGSFEFHEWKLQSKYVRICPNCGQSQIITGV